MLCLWQLWVVGVRRRPVCSLGSVGYIVESGYVYTVKSSCMLVQYKPESNTSFYEWTMHR